MAEVTEKTRLLTGQQCQLLGVVASLNEAIGREIREELAEKTDKTPGVSRTYKDLNVLCEKSLIEKSESGRTKVYKITEDGRKALSGPVKRKARSFGVSIPVDDRTVLNGGA